MSFDYSYSTRFHVARLSVFAFLSLSSIAVLSLGTYLIPADVELMVYPILTMTIGAFTLTAILFE
jgi:hypothetical protein